MLVVYTLGDALGAESVTTLGDCRLVEFAHADSAVEFLQDSRNVDFNFKVLLLLRHFNLFD